MARKTPPRSSARLRRYGPQLVVLLLVFGLASAMAIQPTRQLFEQRDRIAGMSGDLDEIERANRRLESRIRRLQDPDFIEQEAREAGLVRPGETTYVVMPPSRKERAKRTPEARPEPARPPSVLESFLRFVGLG